MNEWQPIETAPHDETIILANFADRCLLTGAPHVWTATYVTKWETLKGRAVDRPPMWCPCSHAASNKNGTATHWMPLPPPAQPESRRDRIRRLAREVSERDAKALAILSRF